MAERHIQAPRGEGGIGGMMRAIRGVLEGWQKV